MDVVNQSLTGRQPPTDSRPNIGANQKGSDMTISIVALILTVPLAGIAVPLITVLALCATLRKVR